MPENGHNCNECGSASITHAADPQVFEERLGVYKASKDELLGFYEHLGLLVDVNLSKGFEDYDKVRQKVQYRMKH